MPTFIASYDLKETNQIPFTTIIEEASKLGWRPWILKNGNVWHGLPTTTLMGEFADRKAAVDALQAAKAATDAAMKRTVVMSKWIVSDFSDATFDSDETRQAQA